MKKKYHLRSRAGGKKRAPLEEVPPPVENLSDEEDVDAALAQSIEMQPEEDNEAASLVPQDHRFDGTFEHCKRSRFADAIPSIGVADDNTEDLNDEDVGGARRKKRGRPEQIYGNKSEATIIRDRAYYAFLLPVKGAGYKPNRRLSFAPRFIGKRTNWVDTNPGFICLLRDEYLQWLEDEERNNASTVVAILKMSEVLATIVMINEDAEFNYAAANLNFHGCTDEIPRPRLIPVDLPNAEVPDPPELQHQDDNNEEVERNDVSSSDTSDNDDVPETSVQEVFSISSVEQSSSNDGAMDESIIGGNIAGRSVPSGNVNHLNYVSVPIQISRPLLSSTVAERTRQPAADPVEPTASCRPRRSSRIATSNGPWTRRSLDRWSL